MKLTFPSLVIEPMSAIYICLLLKYFKETYLEKSWIRYFHRNPNI
jgi:hypothetical protein